MENQPKEYPVEMSASAPTPPAVLASAGDALQNVKHQAAAIHGLLGDVMQKDVHYGVIPGTGGKPTLLKAGAEKIGLLLRLAPSFNREMIWDGAHLTVQSECTLTSITTGIVISAAGAICSTKETKYGYRQVTRVCPECGSAAIIKGKKEYGGGWVCFNKKGGCGAKFPDSDERMAAQSGEREENPNLPDTYNTVLKMADKRAYVAATLFGTAASDIFTQDVEEFGATENPAPSNGGQSTGLLTAGNGVGAPPQPPAQSAPRSAPAPAASTEPVPLEEIEKILKEGTLEEVWKANMQEWMRRAGPPGREGDPARKQILDLYADLSN